MEGEATLQGTMINEQAVSAARFRLKRVSASDQIYEALRERIIALELRPGQSISRAELAVFYGVSQTPVRDAMLKLEQEGLLIIHPQSKTEVSKIDVAHARETQFLRLSLELEVMRRLAQDTSGVRLKPARSLLSQQEAAFGAKDLGHFARLDKNFHLALFEAVGMGNLWRLVTSRSGHIDRLRNLDLPVPGKALNVLKYHAMILDAIESGDLASTESAVRGHLSGTLATIDQIVLRYPEFF